MKLIMKNIIPTIIQEFFPDYLEVATATVVSVPRW